MNKQRRLSCIRSAVIFFLALALAAGAEGIADVVFGALHL